MKCSLALLVVLVALFMSACDSLGGGTKVDVGYVAYQINPEYVPGGDSERFLSIHVAGESYNQDVEKMEEYATIPPGYIGLDGETILSPGIYPRLPKSLVTMELAASIQNEFVGIYLLDGGEEVDQLGPGIYDLRANEVAIFPAGTQRYRTIRQDLVADAAACLSYLCEVTLTGIQLGGTSVALNIDVDVTFEFVFSHENLKRLWEIRNASRAVQNFIATPLRGVRAVDISPEEMQTEAGRQKLAVMYSEALQKATEGQPILVTGVSLRGQAIGDDAYRQSQSEADAALESLRRQTDSLKAQQENATIQMEMTRTAFAGELEMQDMASDNRLALVTAVMTALEGQDEVVKQQVLNVFFPGSMVLATQSAPVSVTIQQGNSSAE